MLARIALILPTFLAFALAQAEYEILAEWVTIK